MTRPYSGSEYQVIAFVTFIVRALSTVERHRNNESRRNRDVQPSLPGRRFRIARPSLFPPPSPAPRTSSVSSYKANVHISGPSAAAAALGLPKNFGPANLFLASSLSLGLPSSLFRTFLKDCVRKCVSGMMHGGRDQKGRKEGGTARGRSGEGGPGGHAGDEGEELVMVMRRCNDSSAVRSELALSLPLSFSPLFPLSILFARLFTFALPSYGDDPQDRLRTFLRLIVHRDVAVIRATRNLLCTAMYAERPRAHTSHNGTAAHFKHGK